MLLEFRVRNYRSIKDLEVFSMLPSKGNTDDGISLLKTGKTEALPTASIFGRNGAGKSNLLDAIARLQDLVLKTSNVGEDATLRFEYYKLEEGYSNLPTYFGIDFIAKDKIKYSYDIEFNNDEFVSEELSFYPKHQKARLFERKKGHISFGEAFLGPKSAIEKQLYRNQLLLSKVRVENIEILKSPFDFFQTDLFYRRPGELTNNNYLAHFARNIYNSKYPKYSENLSRLLRAADTGIVELIAEKRDLASLKMPETIDQKLREQIQRDLEYYIITKHRIENVGAEEIYADFSIFEESMGTRRLLEIGGLMLEALHDGQILIIDEFDISLHPLLTKSMIKLFNSPNTNPNNAQLILSTQDISLFDSNIFSYDQMWIAEKSYEGWSNYYSLSDIKGLRKNVPLQKWYLDGRFGGVPVINYSELEFDIN
jgi:hypothetical protein